MKSFRAAWLFSAAVILGGPAAAQSDYATPYQFSTLAGFASRGSTDGPAASASFNQPFDVAVDQSGNVYVADTGNAVIRKISVGGVVSTLAGLALTTGSADGAGSAARFYAPFGIAADGGGNLYVADYTADTIRKITPEGVVTTIAGALGVRGSTDGTGTAARFYGPTGVAVDANGNVYVTDSGNSTIREITPEGAVSTLAGTAGVTGSTDGTGAAARFFLPFGAAFDAQGNLFVADWGNHTMRKITPGGVVTTLAGLAGSTGSADGTGSAARFEAPQAPAVDSAGNVYVADDSNSSGSGNTIRKITPGGVVTTLAGKAGAYGSADGTGAAAQFYDPFGVAVDSAGNVYVAEQHNNVVRKVTPGGMVTTFAGPAGSTGNVDGTGAAARFSFPRGAAADSAGNIYVADYDDDTVRKVTPAGVVTTLAGQGGIAGSADGVGGSARFNLPHAVAVDAAGNVYVADSSNSTIRKITAGGAVTTLAGTVESYGSVDGTGTAARFDEPFGIAVGADGTVYVSDTGNSTIRKITAAGVVTTLAGTAGPPASADGTGANARFAYPLGIAVDPSGNVYVADQDNHTIRKITPGGVVTTIAGVAGAAGSADGVGAAARFNYPYGLARDARGNLFVADADNDTIRMIAPDETVTTLGGKPGDLGYADGTGSAALFANASGVTVDAAGNLYVVDSGNNVIRKGVSIVPLIETEPAAGRPAVGDAVTLSVGASGTGSLSYVWRKNGVDVTGATAASLAIGDVQPADAGLYDVEVTGDGGTTASAVAVLGATTTAKVAGAGAEVGRNILHPNGNIYDQVLLEGGAAAVTTDPGQVTRTSYIDDNDDIVQVEFSGHGTLSLVLDDASAPALPVNYTQNVNYVKGHAGIVITGADETTNVLVFTVGRATAFDPTGNYNILLPISATNVPADNGSLLFAGHTTTDYDGVADIAFIAISSTDGKFGGLRASDARFGAANGLTGVYAPGVDFLGPVFIGNINATGAATPAIIVGSVSDARITGGSLAQDNGQPVQVSGLTQLDFTAGTDSQGNLLPAQHNQAVLTENGSDVTAGIVVNPGPG